MALENGSESMVMPVQPMGGYGYNNGGFGFGGDGAWWIILFLFAMMGGGWGGGFGGFGGGMFPWLMASGANTNNDVQRGFDQSALMSGLNGIQTSINNGFSTAEVAACNRAMDSMQTAYNNQIASMNRSFAEQTANVQGFNNVNAGIADTRYTIATEACATRNTDTQNTQAIITAVTSGVQSIKDQLSQDKIDAKNDEIAQLRQENLYARGQASQIAQNSAIINGIYDRLSACPVGTVPVYGEQPIFTCNNNGGYGCGNF